MCLELRSHLVIDAFRLDSTGAVKAILGVPLCQFSKHFRPDVEHIVELGNLLADFARVGHREISFIVLHKVLLDEERLFVG